MFHAGEELTHMVNCPMYGIKMPVDVPIILGDFFEQGRKMLRSCCNHGKCMLHVLLDIFCRFELLLMYLDCPLKFCFDFRVCPLFCRAKQLCLFSQCSPEFIY